MAEDGGRVPMSPGLQATLLRAREYAASQSHAQVMLEHLLLALSEDADAAQVLDACRVDLGRLRNDVAGFIGNLDRVAAGTPGAPAISPVLTQVLKYATLAAQQGRRASIDGAIVLAALVGDGRSMAAGFLKSQGLTFDAAIRALKDGANRPPQRPPEPPQPTATELTPPFQAPPAVPAESQPHQLSASRADSILARARERVENRTGHRAEPARGMEQTQPHMPLPVDLGSDVGELPRRALPPSAPFNDPPPIDARTPPLPAPVDGLRHPPEFPGHGADPLPSHLPREQPTASPPFLSPPRPNETIASNGHDDLSRPNGGVNGLAPPSMPPFPPAQPPPSVSSERDQPRSFDISRREVPEPPQHPRSMPVMQPPPRTLPPQRPGGSFPTPPSQIDRPPFPPFEGRAAEPPPARAPAVPSSQPWPRGAEPVRPQSFDPHPPPTRPSSPDTRSRNDHSPLQPVAQPRRPAIDQTQISHTIPARMSEGRMQVIEVRIERPPLSGNTSANRPMSLRGEEAVARALAVRLRSVSGRFIVEPASPETQWDQGGVSGRLASDAAIWRFNVTPLQPGKGALQLAVSARTIGADGVMVETGVPEQTQGVRVSPAIDGWLRATGAAAGWMVLGVALIKVAERLFSFDVFAILR